MKLRPARTCIAAGCLVTILATPSRAALDLVYSQDFQTRTLGAEWSRSTLSYASAFTTFAGRFTNDTITLSLTSLDVGAEHTLVFDLFVIDGWNGAHPVFGGQKFGVDLNGESVMEDTFSNNGNRRAGAHT